MWLISGLACLILSCHVDGRRSCELRPAPCRNTNRPTSWGWSGSRSPVQQAWSKPPPVTNTTAVTCPSVDAASEQRSHRTHTYPVFSAASVNDAWALLPRVDLLSELRPYTIEFVRARLAPSDTESVNILHYSRHVANYRSVTFLNLFITASQHWQQDKKKTKTELTAAMQSISNVFKNFETFFIDMIKWASDEKKR